MYGKYAFLKVWRSIIYQKNRWTLFHNFFRRVLKSSSLYQRQVNKNFYPFIFRSIRLYHIIWAKPSLPTFLIFFTWLCTLLSSFTVQFLQSTPGYLDIQGIDLKQFRIWGRMQELNFLSGVDCIHVKKYFFDLIFFCV